MQDHQNLVICSTIVFARWSLEILSWNAAPDRSIPLWRILGRSNRDLCLFDGIHHRNDNSKGTAVQNSLDAGLPGETVRIVITFPSPDQRLGADAAAHYLHGLREHLDAKGSGLAEGIDYGRPMDFLVIEDFGTRGLAGDVRDDGNQDDAETKNDFYYFWRNIGRAVEGTTTRGRWGLGKTVFQAASRINSFFGLTVRRGETRRLLMGQAVLKIHRSNGRRYAPYGYYGRFEDDFALPVEDPGHIERFCRDFSIRRVDGVPRREPRKLLRSLWKKGVMTLSRQLLLLKRRIFWKVPAIPLRTTLSGLSPVMLSPLKSTEPAVGR